MKDIDLVHTPIAPIGPTIDAIREALVWLGPKHRGQSEHSTHLVFKFSPDHQRIVDCFGFYLAPESYQMTRAQAQQRMVQELTRNLTDDVEPLLPIGTAFDPDDAIEAFNRIWRDFIDRIPGVLWKLADEKSQNFGSPCIRTCSRNSAKRENTRSPQHLSSGPQSNMVISPSCRN